MKKPYRHRCINYNHRAVVSLFGFAHAHDGHVAQVKQEHRSINHIRRGSWHAQRRQRSCDTLDNLKRSCSLRCQHQGRSRPDGIARGVHESSGTVSGNARRRKQRSSITSSRVSSGVTSHDRGRDQGRSRPSAALHVCTNRVALLQRLLCWPTV